MMKVTFVELLLPSERRVDEIVDRRTLTKSETAVVLERKTGTVGLRVSMQ